VLEVAGGEIPRGVEIGSCDYGLAEPRRPVHRDGVQITRDTGDRRIAQPFVTGGAQQIGIGRPQEIEIVGEDVARVNFGFQVGDNMASRFGHALWFSPLKALQRMCFRTPLVYLFIFGSYVYHDFLWWPLQGKRIQRAHALNTPWGRLFESYPT
jgi:hypothetical protein